jgi:hypothetical protein
VERESHEPVGSTIALNAAPNGTARRPLEKSDLGNHLGNQR